MNGARTHRRSPSRPGGGLRGSHCLLLGVLLVAPGVALYRGSGSTFVLVVGGWVAALSFVSFLVLWIDKRRAGSQGAREPEIHLHLIELLGGWPGSFAAQRLFRHKTAKASYQVVFWGIVAIHEALAIDALLGWPVAHALHAFLR